MATAAQTAAVKVGDVFESSWGYDQTNVDFYEVVAVTPSGKSVKVRRLRSAYADGSHVVPATGPDRFASTAGVPLDSNNEQGNAKGITKRLRLSYRGVPMFTVASYADAYLWDGVANYETPMGFGH